MQNSQVPMTSPPQAITSKDLLYLKDALSWELLAAKKFHFLAQQVSNQEIQQALDNAGRMHQDHFQRILSHLQVNNNVVMSNMPNPNQNMQH
ncbi:ferritin family protein [Bacillus massilinigeriensis]|uniref:rubrerythrin family protein n=1 Tax=Bacillus massilionigeriensis TaxID=1805475 RepID=UPI00096B5141|nr:rubrerythrin family protein [Bacillus massilionigeriensis]